MQYQAAQDKPKHDLKGIEKVKWLYFIIAPITLKIKIGKVIKIKNPNGFGTVVKLSGNRRNPWCARRTVGFNEKGHPIYKAIGYYPKQADALTALGEYNHNPYDIDLAKITLKELFERWSAKDFPKMPKTTASSHKSAYKHMRMLHDVPYRKIKAFQMQEVIDNCGAGYSSQASIKSLFGKLDEYAMKLEIINRMNSDLIHAAPVTPKDKTPFTDEEVRALWKIKNEPWVDSVLFLLYTGFRISEMFDLECCNIDLDNMTMCGGTKTKSGKNRIVPIHPDIADIVRARIAQGNQYLFTNSLGKKLIRSVYIRFWDAVLKQINSTHTPHEARHTLRSKLDSAKANKKCIDMIMGHKSKDVGERVYTHKTIEELKEAIELLKY